ncbi:MAG: NAD(P)-dependent oxidoreductase [Actinomycetota bacterium]|nr:NAD(P)-dependent oxidoreductase [Actinomycetota bacterium]
MRVFVLGGTGAIGRHVVPALIAAGHTVSALARSAEKAAWLREQGATPALVSLFDRDALTGAFAGHDAVANLASAMPSMSHFLRTKAFGANTRVRVEGSAAVANAALAAGVGRLVQESVAMLYPDRGANWIDEATPIDRYPMAEANLAAEDSARRFADAGRTATVLRFGLFYGPGAAHSEQMFVQASHHVAMVVGPPGSYLSSIHLTDAASAVVAALDGPGGVFNVVDDEPLTKRHYAQALAVAAGTSIWFKGPGRAALLLGDRLTSLTRSLRVSNGRMRGSGWAPRFPSAREGWIVTAGALRSAPSG